MASVPDEQSSDNRWTGRPRAALAVKLVAWLTPIVVSVVVTQILAKLFPRPPGIVPTLSWFVVIAFIATATLWATDRLARRLLPLAALFQLSLVFPDSAPSRFKSAMRTQTVHQLAERVAEIKASGLSDEPAVAAETLIDLVAALSAHDRLTRGHAERVRAYSRMIGEEMKLPEADVDMLQWAGLLHDVGKLFTPSEILNKPGRLTDEEFEIIKLHPGQGAALVEPLRGWLGDWVDAVGQHHERIDGQGYPSGLAGDEISLSARIVSVADVFDVITSVRSYKPALGSAEAREELARCAGTYFDRNVVRAFLNISLGRLRLAMGPLSWAAQLPLVGRVPLGPVFGGGASVVATAATLAVGGVFSHPTHSPVDAKAEAAAPAPATTVFEELPPPSSLVVTTTVPRAALIAIDDASELAEGGSIDIDVGANDQGAVTASVTDQPPTGVVEQLGGTMLRFTPVDDFFGDTTFGYTIDDGAGSTASAVVRVTVTPVPDAPVAIDDTATAEQDGSVNIPVLLNDSDADGDPLSIASVSSADGRATIDGTTVDYVPTPGTSGTHTIDYVVADGTGLTATAVVTVTVNPAPRSAPTPPTTAPPTTAPPTTAPPTTAPPTTTPPTTAPPTTTPPTTAPPTTTPPTTVPPRAPVARDDAAVVDEDESVGIAVLANDTDPDVGDTLTVTSASSADGAATTDGTTVDYAPAGNSNGTHTITYTIRDGTGLTDTATVTVTVNPINDSPTANPDTATIDEDTSINIDALANDTDPDTGDTLTITSVSSPDGATTTDSTTIDYTPSTNANGTHAITYTIDDGNGGTDFSTVTVAVNPINDAPVAVDDSGAGYTTSRNLGFTTANVTTNDSDIDSSVDATTATVVSTTSNGVLGPLGRIDIDEVHQHRQAHPVRVLSHRGREDHRSVDVLPAHRVPHPGFQRRISVVAQCQGFTAHQAGQAGQARARRVQARDMQIGAQGAQCVDMGFVVRVVDERAEEHPVSRHQMLEQVIRAHLVALVGRVRQAMHQVQEIGHADYPRLRTMNGPSQLASPIGMRRQVSISSLYLALDGLFCGIASRL